MDVLEARNMDQSPHEPCASWTLQVDVSKGLNKTALASIFL